MSKEWLTSKTLWMNVLCIIALIAQSQFGFVIDAALQASLLAMINILLRTVTKEPIVWKTE